MTEREFIEWLNSINFNPKEENQMPEINSIAWHQECLNNRRKYAAQLTDEMNRLKAQIKRLDSENAFHLHQIRQAQKQGKSRFDADKFCQSRKRKCDRCGAVKPQGQSCICFDNHCQ